MTLDLVAARQNPDGGWPYRAGRSWTEPTVYAILALLAAGSSEPARRGRDWLFRAQRPDGGWPPQTGVEESTWVTALVALLPEDFLGGDAHARAIRWLLDLTGKETSFSYRLRERLLGNPIPPEHRNSGWPWIPGAAAWVGPTSIGLLAMDKEFRKRPSPKIAARLDAGRKFLLARMCQDGGWNHGSVRALGYESLPYPETTGMALAALRGVRSPRVDLALAVANRFLAECRSADALNWLRLGLLAHGRLPPGFTPPEVPFRTCHELSLDAVVNAFEKGHDLVWG